ncbi:class-II fumarase/aspartase family protein [Methylobacterium nonmethylotrophicum]|uniref:Adenylosuccinate lyase family protein n=1 Tax=Methylobacterium nonmethylotrophicum TaxID=1141884 RepID=A0A4Z0NU08_9HYPH|nr:adenylosuccinate lyase family protein [Methylobacterium nonmethylotrophicum]TGE00695.1 adenylosuccinate lyase family protein [Methylobacterium nonmethylotrophicum]
MTLSALDSALLGPLFATDAMRAVFADEARVAAMLRAEAALARAQAEAGLVPASLAPAIAAIDANDLDPSALGRRTAVSGVPVIPFVKAVQGALPPELEPAFHKATTTQDIADTALVLQVRDALDLVAADLRAILDGLSGLARKHRETPCVGRTYGQHAAPVTFGFKAAIWALGIAEVAALLPALRDRVLTASLGGPVGTLAGLGEKAEAVGDGFAAALGLHPDLAPWHTRRARIAETGSWLALLTGALAKFATDVAHLATTEVGEVAEPYVPGRGGSSAMPHKRNPVSSTVILAAFGAAKGVSLTLLDGMAAAHERPAGAWHAEWHALPTLFGLASGSLREARGLAQGLVPDPDRMARNLDLTKGLLFADAAAGRLSPVIGAKAAHALVEEAAGAVRDGQGSLREVLRARPETAGSDLDSAFDLSPAIRAGARTADRALAEVSRLAAFLHSA